MDCKLFGVLNITPDSFSDSNLYSTKEKALFHARELSQSVYAIDIGPQSTRPNAKIINYEQEILRLGSIIQEISQFAKTSIDSFHFQTQKFAIEQGITYINDVTGFCDEKIFQYAPQNIRFIFMHNLGVPPVKTNVLKFDGDEMIREIKNWGKKKLQEFQALGVKSDRFVFDIGIGFGKTAEQSLFLIENIEQFCDFPTPIMVGHSRKSFMELIKPNSSIDERDTITQNLTKAMSQKGIEYFRIHKV
jgi:dihydropteroate synthase